MNETLVRNARRRWMGLGALAIASGATLFACVDATKSDANDGGADDASTPAHDSSAPHDATPADSQVADASPEAEPTLVCAPPAAGYVYVDAVLGVDDATHGGGPGACAVHTIAYAATRTGGEIRLDVGTHAAPEVVDLDGGQSLACPADGGAIVAGQGDSGTWHTTVRFSGTGNAVRHCVLQGNDSNGYCVDVWGSAAVLQGATLGKCGGAAVRILGGAGHTFTGNTFVTTSLPGLFFQGAADASINDNTFAATTNGIGCNTACGLTGANNVRVDGGAATCSAACNCPDGSL